MISAPKTNKWRLMPAAVISSIVLGLSVILAFFLLLQRQEAIQQAADRIYDVAIPSMSEATRMVRGLERLARTGEALMWIEELDQRQIIRQSLASIAADGVLQGDPATRTTVTTAFAVLDENLASLAQRGKAARALCLARWHPIKQQLLDLSESKGSSASLAAIEDAEQIVLEANASRERFLRLAAALVCVLAISLSFFFSRIVRPLIRLAEALEQAQTGHYVAGRPEFFREFQMLSGGAEALANDHRALVANKIELEQLAHSDVLTGLANRRRFMVTAGAELSRHDRYGYVTSLIMFDLDNFKQINDRYGHEGGDAVLRAIGKGLSDLVRRSDLLARIGGEEFAVLLPDQGHQVATLSAQRLRAAIEAMVIETATHGAIRATASFGVAEHVKDETLEALINRADTALYEAKNSGRNRVVVAASSVPPVQSDLPVKPA